jgi:hypothetical protein
VLHSALAGGKSHGRLPFHAIIPCAHRDGRGLERYCRVANEKKVAAFGLVEVQGAM